MPAKEFTVKWLDKPNELLLDGKTQVSYFERQRRGRALMLVVGRETKTWRVRFYEKGGRANSAKLGGYPDLRLAEARKLVATYDPVKAREEAERRASEQTFRQVADEWVTRHVEANGLRSKPEIVRTLNTYVYPEWGKKPFLKVRRAEVIKLLDGVADNNGPSMANSVLAVVSNIMGWYRLRDEHYVSPIVKGMRRPTTSRARILSDLEIRAVWEACSESGSFGALLQACLLTAQRSRKVATMRWSDFQGNVWTIATERREKSNAGVLILPDMAMATINAQPKLNHNPFVFPGQGKRPFGAWSIYKRKLDAKLPEDMPHWTVHDLRRTARSLLSRKAAGISSDIAERLLGHSIGGVEGVYDRHAYTEEKAEALKALAALVKNIVEPPPLNVVSISMGRLPARASA